MSSGSFPPCKEFKFMLTFVKLKHFPDVSLCERENVIIQFGKTAYIL